MPKFNLDINGVGVKAAEGREAWSGPLPKTGTYEGTLRVVGLGTISDKAENAGKPKLNIGVELKNTEDGKYDGYVAWGSLSLIDASIPFVNQFLWCLTDGSNSAKEAIEKGFYKGGIVTDERQKHIEKIGAFKIESPKANIPIRVSLSNRSFFNEATKTTNESVRIESYLPAGGVRPTGAGATAQEAEFVSEEEDSYDAVAYDDDGDVLN